MKQNNAITSPPAFRQKLSEDYQRVPVAGCSIKEQQLIEGAKKCIDELANSKSPYNLDFLKEKENILPAWLNPELDELYFKEDDVYALCTMKLGVGFEYSTVYRMWHFGDDFFPVEVIELVGD